MSIPDIITSYSESLLPEDKLDIEHLARLNSLTRGEVTKENSKLYSDSMVMIDRLYNKTTAYNSEDFATLLETIKDLETLLQKGTPPSGPSEQMSYNIQMILKTLVAAGITSKGASNPLAAMESWAKDRDSPITPWGSNASVSSATFIEGSAAASTEETPSTQYLIQTLILEGVYDYYRTELEGLADKSQITIQIIETLTILVNLANEVNVKDIEPFEYPLTNSGQLPEPGSETDKLIRDIMKETSYNEGIGQNYEYNGQYDEYEGMEWQEAYAAAYADDQEAARALMAENPGMTMEEAMAEQNRASTVFNEFMSGSGELTAENATKIMEALIEDHFKTQIEASGSTPEELEALWSSVMDCRDTLEELLNAIDPIPVPTPDDFVAQRDQPNTLAYFLEQIITDIDSVEGATDAEKAMNWLMLCVADEDGSTSSFMNHINQAINAATSLNTEQKQEMQKLLMLFQNFMTMLSSIMKTLNQIIVSTAQKIGKS